MFIGIEWIVAGVLIALAIVAYLFSGAKGRKDYFRDLDNLKEYRPPVRVLLEYRTNSGDRYSGPFAVLRSLSHRSERRLYLLGFLGKKGGKPRMFRVDRIVSVKTPDGKPIDKKQFLTARLGIPRELCV